MWLDFNNLHNKYKMFLRMNKIKDIVQDFFVDTYEQNIWLVVNTWQKSL